MSGEDLAAYLSDPLEQRTPKTITDPARLRREIEQVRRTGVGIQLGEYEIGFSSYSSAVHNDAGDPIAYISIIGPEFRIPDARLDEFISPLLDAAEELTTQTKLSS
jgi:DNA-binding IclR family transcriptional regulator